MQNPKQQRPAAAAPPAVHGLSPAHTPPRPLPPQCPGAPLPIRRSRIPRLLGSSSPKTKNFLALLLTLFHRHSTTCENSPKEESSPIDGFPCFSHIIFPCISSRRTRSREQRYIHLHLHSARALSSHLRFLLISTRTLGRTPFQLFFPS